MLTAAEIEPWRIFAPFSTEKFLNAQQSDLRFAHYSSAVALKSMILNKEVWMRKISCMNDYAEVRHGTGCLIDAIHSEKGKRLKIILDNLHPELFDDVLKTLDGWLPYFWNNTYITCVSEHDPEEDRIGRLSMWRAYGKTIGVAAVLKNTPFLRPSNGLNAWTSPVAYLRGGDFIKEFQKVVENVEENSNSVKNMDRNIVHSTLFNALYFACLCTKHPGFREEREWRVIYSPMMHPSDVIEQRIEDVRGEPQIIQSIPLADNPERDLIGFNVRDLIDSIIIGPCENAHAIQEAFTHILGEAGVPDAEEKVISSDIPVR